MCLLFLNNCLAVALHLLHNDLLFLWQKHLRDALFPHRCKRKSNEAAWSAPSRCAIENLKQQQQQQKEESVSYIDAPLRWFDAGWPPCSTPRSPSESGRPPPAPPCLCKARGDAASWAVPSFGGWCQGTFPLGSEMKRLILFLVWTSSSDGFRSFFLLPGRNFFMGRGLLLESWRSRAWSSVPSLPL